MIEITMSYIHNMYTKTMIKLWIDNAFPVCSLHLFPSPLAGGASLGPDDLNRLYKFLKLAAPGWRKIGRALDFKIEELDAIPLMSALISVDDYFQKLLHRWLKRIPERTTTVILAGALESAGEGRLADELVNEF